MEARTNSRQAVTAEELREAEKGLVRLLHAKRFPREWIERNVPDVMAQARTDFAARLAAGKKDETVNLLVVIGYRRAVKVLDAQLAAPSTTSIETVFHLADESAPTPEEEVIEHDREERVVKAMAHLPDRERKLMALIYFDGRSVRDAGRRLGWGKSSADRHHRAALEKLHELLDRSLLSPEISIPAYIAARHWQNSPLPAVERWMQGAGETAAEGLMVGSGRLGHAVEGASAAASSGAGRTAAGVCGAAVAVCLTGAATGVIGSGGGVLGAGEKVARPAPQQREATAADTVPIPLSVQPPIRPNRAEAKDPAPLARSTSRQADSTTRGAVSITEVREPQVRRERRTGSVSAAPAATPRATINEFGLESGEADSPSQESAAAPTSVPQPPSEPVPAPAPSPQAAPAAGPSGPGRAAGNNFGAEFGM
jgi:RNA polymerase sigma factor (sigma-70 family)